MNNRKNFDKEVYLYSYKKMIISNNSTHSVIDGMKNEESQVCN